MRAGFYEEWGNCCREGWQHQGLTLLHILMPLSGVGGEGTSPNFQWGVKLSLGLNVIETNKFLLQKEWVNKIELGIKSDPTVSENVKNGRQ